MLHLLFSAVVAPLFPFVMPREKADYSLTTQQQLAARGRAAASSTPFFPTPTEAAFAASLRYARAMPDGEIGVKIYMDVANGSRRYTYGSLVFSQVNSDGEDEIIYDDTQTDGHFAVVGLWHEHPMPSSWPELYGHQSTIAQTHQAIWTTVGLDFYVQYWDGSMVMPQWLETAPAIQPLCRDCEH
jgi:hypothetical protein